jgi:hypothetical protein
MSLDLVHFLNTYAVPFFLVIVTIPFLFIGLLGIITKRPVFIPQQFLQYIVWIIMLPGVVDQGVAYWWVQILYVSSVIFTVIVTRGYYVLGATDESFRTGVLASLAKLNLPYEEFSDGLRLPTLGADLQTTSFGGRSLRMKQRRFSSVLHSIVKEMKNYYRSSNEIEVKMGHFISYFIFGMVGALLALPLALFPPVSRISTRHVSVTEHGDFFSLPFCNSSEW